MNEITPPPPWSDKAVAAGAVLLLLLAVTVKNITGSDLINTELLAMLGTFAIAASARQVQEQKRHAKSLQAINTALHMPPPSETPTENGDGDG